MRPTLEYAVSSWSPWLQKDISLLEKTQKRCIKLSTEEITIQSLEERRKNFDLCETYKYVTNKYKTPGTKLFKFTNTRKGLKSQEDIITK